MQLVVEDEQIARRAGLSVSDRFQHVDKADIEKPAEYFVHGEECSGHPSGARQESPPVDREFLSG
jgi:hypothetical protein